MKRTTLTTAVLAGLTGMAGMISVANAVNVNPDGLGQVLLYPYYTARGGNDTLVSVVNTTSEAKSVKVRFLEGLNSREVLDFNLYMSPFDVWTASITDLTMLDADPTTPELEPLGEGVGILTNDSSCTVPYFFGDQGGVQEFLGFGFNIAPDPDNGIVGTQDGGPTDIERSHSGYIEIIEMATLTDATEGSASAATHDPDTGEPANCQQLVAAWTAIAPGSTSFDPDLNNYWLGTDNEIDNEQPTGGLFGGASIINVNDGLMFSYNATAIDGFADAGIGGSNHTDPGNTQPNLDSGGNFESIVFNNGVVETIDWTGTGNLANSVQAVTAVLMHDQLMNEYAVNPGLQAASEWVVSFPTKRFYVDGDFADAIAGVSGGTPVAPFTEVWADTPRAPGSAAGACEPVEFAIWDREELVPGQGPGPDPVPPIPSPPPADTPPPTTPTFDLCFETNVIRFAQPGETADETAAIAATEILRETRFTTLQAFTAGWAELNFNSPTLVDPMDNPVVHATEAVNGQAYFGLPAIGFWVNTFNNGVLDGGAVQRNFGGTFQHRGTRVLTTAP